MLTRTRLLLVRHGETPANVEGVWHGSTDSPLTKRGRSQAQRVAQWIAATDPRPTALYSSPLTRARHTAQAIGGPLGLTEAIDADLAEYHLGALEGISYRVLATQHRLFERMQADPDCTPGDGESPRQVGLRCMAALRRIAAAHPGERIVVVGHGGALTLGLGLLLDGDPGAWRRVMDNAAVTELVVADQVELVSFNLTDHLADA